MDATHGADQARGRPQAPELLALALPLRAAGAGAVPPGLGTAGHGLVFGLLAQASPQAGDALHAPAAERAVQRQPFTVSPLLNAPDGDPLARVDPKTPCWLRLTFLTEAMVRLWVERLMPALPDPLWLGLRDGLPEDWVSDYALAGATIDVPYRAARFADLLAAPVAERRRLHVATPATFQLPVAPEQRAEAPRGLCLPLPVPGLILANLARAWTSWAPPSLRDLAAPAAVAALERHVQLEDSRVAIAPAVIRGDVRMAFSGDIVLAYRPGPREPRAATAERLRLLGALLELATYSGLGVQTARGMGIVRLAPNMTST